MKKRQEEVDKQRKKMDLERKSRQRYVEGLENMGSGHRRSLDHQMEAREGKRGDALEQKDRDREAEAIRVRIKPKH